MSISTGVGLISGINTADIIEQLMSIESRPKTLIQQRITETNNQKVAFTDLATRLATLKLTATTFKKPSTFQQANVSSSNSDVLTATAAPGAAKGSYQFQVARLVSAQQSIGAGFADTSTQTVGAGTLTFELGGGEITSQTNLAQLNGGAGVRRGAFRLTDGSGHSALVDVSDALTLDDVVRKINTSLDVNVRAEIAGDSLKLTDLSGGAQQINVQDLAGSYAAKDLGILGVSVGGVLSGQDIAYIGRNTALSDLNDGRGVRSVGSTVGPDFQVSNSAGTAFNISLDGVSTVGQLIDKIATATGGSVTVSIDAGSSSLKLSEFGGGSLSVTAMNGSKAAADLGIEGSGVGTMQGKAVQASPNTVLLSSLRGGQGLDLGVVRFQSRTGASVNVDFTGATTVQDLLDRINANAIGIKAEIKSSGNGIAITDSSGGLGPIAITDQGATTTAAQLGIAGSFNSTYSSVQGANLQRQWVSETTLLTSLNGGKGIAPGEMRLINAAGTSVDVEIKSTFRTVQDVLKAINANTIGITASINANGDGLLISDSSGGTVSKLKIEDLTGSAARDLGVLGTATATTLDGSYERTITLSGTETLEAAVTKINDLGFAVTAAIVNDGSTATPFRLSLTARDTGRAGRFGFDAGTTSLASRNLVDAQDAAVFLGAAGGQQPLVVTSSSNKISNVIKGVTLDLHAASSNPVTLNVTANSEAVVSEAKKFVENFNGLVAKIKELTAFDSETNKKGILLGSSAALQIQTELYSVVQRSVSGAGRYDSLLDIGIKVVSGAKLELDEAKFNEVFAKDPDAVNKLFTLTTKDADGKTVGKGMGYLMETGLNKLIDPVSGVITRHNKALEAKTDDFQDRITSLDKLLEGKKARLERQFASMETVLAGLQSQQNALSSLQTLTPLSSSKK